MNTARNRLVPQTDLDRALIRSVIEGKLGLTVNAAVPLRYAGETSDAEPGLELSLGYDWSPTGELIGYLRCATPDSLDIDAPTYRVYFWVEAHDRLVIDCKVIEVAWRLGEPVRSKSESFPPVLRTQDNLWPFSPIIARREIFGEIAHAPQG